MYTKKFFIALIWSLCLFSLSLQAEEIPAKETLQSTINKGSEDVQEVTNTAIDWFVLAVGLCSVGGYLVYVSYKRQQKIDL